MPPDSYIFYYQGIQTVVGKYSPGIADGIQQDAGLGWIGEVQPRPGQAEKKGTVSLLASQAQGANGQDAAVFPQGGKGPPLLGSGSAVYQGEDSCVAPLAGGSRIQPASSTVVVWVDKQIGLDRKSVV